MIDSLALTAQDEKLFVFFCPSFPSLVLGIIFFSESLMESTEPNSLKLNLAAYIVSSQSPTRHLLPWSSSFHVYSYDDSWAPRLRGHKVGGVGDHAPRIRLSL